MSKSNTNWYLVTVEQLKRWNVKYHELRMGKPAYDILIDDRVLNSVMHWTEENVYKIIK